MSQRWCKGVISLHGVNWPKEPAGEWETGVWEEVTRKKQSENLWDCEEQRRERGGRIRLNNLAKNTVHSLKSKMRLKLWAGSCRPGTETERRAQLRLSLSLLSLFSSLLFSLSLSFSFSFCLHMATPRCTLECQGWRHPFSLPPTLVIPYANGQCTEYAKILICYEDVKVSKITIGKWFT